MAIIPAGSLCILTGSADGMNTTTVNSGALLEIGDTAGNPGTLQTGNMTVFGSTGPGDSLDINTAGILEVSGTGAFIGTVTVLGELEAEGSPNPGSTAVTFSGTGTVGAGGLMDVLPGASAVFEPGSTWTVAAGGALRGGTYFVFAPLTISGTIGSSDLDMQVNSPTTNSGSLVGAGALSGEAELQWYAGALGLGGGISDGGFGKIEALGSAAKLLSCNLDLSSGHDVLGGSGLITISSGDSILNTAGDSVPTTTLSTSLAGPGSLINNGTLSLDPSLGAITIACPYTAGSMGVSPSTLEIESGKGTNPVTFSGGGTLRGTLAPNDGTLIFADGTGGMGTTYSVTANLDTQWSPSDSITIDPTTTLAIASGVSADFDHLTLTGNVTGAGDLSVNSDGFHDDDSLLWTGGTMSGTGTTLIGGNGDYTGAILTVGTSGGEATYSMGGRTLDNKGKVVVIASNTLTVPSATLTNSGELDVLAGAALSTASGVTVDNDSHGVINVSGTATLAAPTLDNEHNLTVAAGATLSVSGGTMTNGSSATFTTSGTSTLTGVPLDNEGDVTVSSGGTLALSADTLTNDQQLVDNGSITLANGAGINSEGDSTLTGTIGFGGSRNGSEAFLNNGTLLLDGTSTSPSIDVPFQSGSNSGLPSVINVQIDSPNTSSLTDGGTLSGNLNLNHSALTLGGSFSVPANLTAAYSAGDLLTIGNGATLNIASGITAALDHVALSGTITGAGELTIDGDGQHGDDALNWTGGTMSGTGTTLIGGATINGQYYGASLTVSGSDTLDSRTLVNAGNATITSAGSLATHNSSNNGGPVIDNQQYATFLDQAGSNGFGGGLGTFNNSGTLELDSGAVARLTTYTQTSTGTFIIHIASPGGPGQLDLGGTAALAGAIDVILDNGFQLSSGATVPLLSAEPVSGTFTTATLPTGSTLQYTSSGVSLHKS